jgi:hypothetical protein
VTDPDLPLRPERYEPAGLVAALTLNHSRPELLDLLGEEVGWGANPSGRVTKDQLAETLVYIYAMQGRV